MELRNSTFFNPNWLLGLVLEGFCFELIGLIVGEGVAGYGEAAKGQDAERNADLT